MSYEIYSGDLIAQRIKIILKGKKLTELFARREFKILIALEQLDNLRKVSESKTKSFEILDSISFDPYKNCN